MIPINRLFKNFSWLAISQAANLALPLFIYPYILRIITIEAFGMVVLAQAVSMYFVQLADYGFSITAVQHIATHKENNHKVNSIFSLLYSTRLLLLVLSFGLFFMLVNLISEWKAESSMFISSFSIVIGQAMMPIWWYQGKEKMNGVAYMNIISKAIFLISILFLIQGEDDYIYINLCLGGSQILVGGAAIMIIVLKNNLRWPLSTISSIKSVLKHNYPIFLSNLFGFISGNSNLLIVGLLADPISTGYYGIIEKILLAIRAPAVLLYQTVFPRVCLLAEKSFRSLLQFLKRLTHIILLVFIPMSVLIIIFADHLIFLFTNEYLQTPTILLQIISFVPLFAALNIPACQTMLAYGLRKSYARTMITGAALNIILNISLISLFSVYGAALAALSTELLITSLLFTNLAVFHKDYSVISVFNLTLISNGQAN